MVKSIELKCLLRKLLKSVFYIIIYYIHSNITAVIDFFYFCFKLSLISTSICTISIRSRDRRVAWVEAILWPKNGSKMEKFDFDKVLLVAPWA